MPNFSGTVSSSQGVRTIDVTPNDVVTFTPTGTYSVEYPIGIVAVGSSSSGATVLTNTSATQMRVLCVTGSVAYSCVDGRDDTNTLTPAAAAALQILVSGAGTYVNTNGALYGLTETTPYQTPAPTASTLLITGPCELAGWFCSAAAGTITIYDALSAAGTPIVPATTLVVGPLPIFGANTTGKLVLTTGCFVVLSGAATVRVLVG